jgi:hypothetical protein
MSAQTLLSTGDKWYAYSGQIFGDVSSPATIPLVTIPNTGLRDSYVVIQYSCGQIVSSGGDQLGLSVKMNDVEIINAQSDLRERDFEPNTFNIFVPRQNKLEIISLNTGANNTQLRGVTVIGYYL